MRKKDTVTHDLSQAGHPQDAPQTKRTDPQHKASLKNLEVLCTSALLVAVGVILGFFKIPITQLIEIRLQSVPYAIGAMLFGPAIGGLIGGLVDFLSYIVKPTGPYFPGFTVSAVVTGVIFGLLLHKKTTIPRIILAEVLRTLIVGMVLNPLWLSILYGNGFWAVFIARLPAQLVMLPINCIIMIAIVKPVRILVTRPART